MTERRYIVARSVHSLSKKDEALLAELLREENAGQEAAGGNDLRGVR